MDVENFEIRIEIFGRVQGVRFRHFVKEEADKLRIMGYVLNREDGSVLVVGQGERDNLEVFLHNVQRGPVLAKVQGVSYRWKVPERNYENFVIALDKGMVEDQKSSFTNLGKKIFGIKKTVPEHIAIIPDGNRRWAKNKGLSSTDGHKKSASLENVKPLMQKSKELGAKYLTIWAFSTENWNRDKKEIDYLFKLISKYMKDFKKYALEENIRFRHIGRKDRIPKKILKELEDAEDKTRNCDGFFVQICFDYGGRDEITRAINRILKSGIQEIKEEDIRDFLDSAEIPDPDLIIRTSGEKRTSGFMPFQSTYAELYFTDKFFPDFSEEDIEKAVDEFSKRRRKFGK